MIEAMTATPTTARFTVHQVHLFKEADDDRAVTYCGLSERGDICRDHGETVTCGRCIRYATREQARADVIERRSREPG
jgi:hypothetical protein